MKRRALSREKRAELVRLARERRSLGEPIRVIAKALHLGVGTIFAWTKGTTLSYPDERPDTVRPDSSPDAESDPSPPSGAIFQSGGERADGGVDISGRSPVDPPPLWPVPRDMDSGTPWWLAPMNPLELLRFYLTSFGGQLPNLEGILHRFSMYRPDDIGKLKEILHQAYLSPPVETSVLHGYWEEIDPEGFKQAEQEADFRRREAEKKADYQRRLKVIVDWARERRAY